MKANDTRAKGMVFNQKAGEYIQELEQQLEKERSRPDYSYEAQEQLAELREAIQTHRDSFGPPEDHTEEDRALWAALKEKGK